jgi:3-(3-hydroxy-phenyl)propionate hydroxylase
MTRHTNQARDTHAVVIAGGGPTGLMLAAELAIAGADVAIVERRPNQALAGSRAGGLHPRTLEILDQRGVADRFISQGQKHTVVPFHVPLDLTDCPTRHNYVLGLGQNHTERILAEWVGELGVPILRERDVIGFTQDGDGVDVTLADGASLRARYLVGCDGGRSVIRKATGVEFPGTDATTSWLIVEAETTEEPAWGFRHDAFGSHGIGKTESGRGVRAVLTERQVRGPGEPTLDDVRAALVATYGTDFGIHDATWVSRFTDMTRQAAAYRVGRVLLAGDAAHVHPPLGGQGLNHGVQDAVNLGWKLAQVVKGTSPDSLLDTYHAERHPAGVKVLRHTMALSALRRPDEGSKALTEFVSTLVTMDEPRRRVAADTCGLTVHYDLGDGHPLLGRRVPDLDLLSGAGPRRLFTRLHDARPLFVNFGEPGRFDIAPWADRVQAIEATADGPWDLPAVGRVPPPTAILVRPDGHVAWVGESADDSLRDALTRWFGPPLASSNG